MLLFNSQELQSRFSKIAPRYDLFNQIITFGMDYFWKKYLVKMTLPHSGQTILDLCCGTGTILKIFQKYLPDSNELYGLDFSSSMLKIAQQRCQLTLDRLIQADACNLPFHDDQFDIISMGYGLRNLQNRSQGLQEIYRVLKPGGIFACLDFGKIHPRFFRPFFDFYFFKIVPKIGRWFYPNEDLFDYFPASTINYPSQQELAKILIDTGFQNIRIKNFCCGVICIHFGIKTDHV